MVKESKLLIYLKGMLMGICDIIPGISGGTIAFITGIYARLINAVKGISPKILYDFFKFLFSFKRENLELLKSDLKKLDLGFLIVLVLGIMTSIFIGSRIIKFLLDNYFSYTISFFIGLILASSKIIFDNIDNKKFKNLLFGVIGLLAGFFLSVLIPLNIDNPSLGYVFIGGFFAISAMFLPGISGAFILLIMGLYEFIINALHSISNNINPLLIFIVGAALGAFFISRVISFLFRKDKSKTLYFLLGLVLGSLSIPFRKILNGSPSFLDLFIIIVFLIFGILIVKITKDYAKDKKKLNN